MQKLTLSRLLRTASWHRPCFKWILECTQFSHIKSTISFSSLFSEINVEIPIFFHFSTNQWSQPVWKRTPDQRASPPFVLPLAMFFESQLSILQYIFPAHMFLKTRDKTSSNDFHSWKHKWKTFSLKTLQRGANNTKTAALCCHKTFHTTLSMILEPEPNRLLILLSPLYRALSLLYHCVIPYLLCSSCTSTTHRIPSKICFLRFCSRFCLRLFSPLNSNFPCLLSKQSRSWWVV